MLTEKRKTRLWLIAAVLLAVFLFTACASGASRVSEKIELGQKYLTELNYTEAVAAFTEVIKINPSNIEAYVGRAEAYKGLKQYEDIRRSLKKQRICRIRRRRPMQAVQRYTT